MAPGALRALQGGRGGAVHHRAVPAAAPARQQRAPASPRAPFRRAADAAAAPASEGALPGRSARDVAHRPARRGLGCRGASMRRLLTVLSMVAAATGAFGPMPRLEAQTAGAPGVVWSDVTSASGIAFRHTNGAWPSSSRRLTAPRPVCSSVSISWLTDSGIALGATLVLESVAIGFRASIARPDTGSWPQGRAWGRFVFGPSPPDPHTPRGSSFEVPVEAAEAVDGVPRSSASKRRPPLLGRGASKPSRRLRAHSYHRPRPTEHNIQSCSSSS